MNRRSFIETVATGTVGSVLPLNATGHRSELRRIASSREKFTWFPHISAPQLIAPNTLVYRSGSNCYQHARGRDIRLPALEVMKVSAQREDSLRIVGVKDGKLLQFDVTSDGGRSRFELGNVALPHPAVGLDFANFGKTCLIVACGKKPRTLELFEPHSQQMLLADHRWMHPSMVYDSERGRLHLLLTPWNEYSSIYDVIYYLRSDDRGKSWSRSDGTPLKLPLKLTPPEHGEEPVEAEAISVRGQPAGGESNTLPHCFTLDRDGAPHLLYSFCRPYFVAVGPQMNEPIEPRMRTKHLRLAKEGWIASEMCANWEFDVAGGTLHTESPKHLRALVMFKKKEAHWLDLGYTESNDAGKSWTQIAPITGDAAAREHHYLSPTMIQTADGLQFACKTFSAKGYCGVYMGMLRHRI